MAAGRWRYRSRPADALCNAASFAQVGSVCHAAIVDVCKVCVFSESGAALPRLPRCTKPTVPGVGQYMQFALQRQDIGRPFIGKTAAT